MIAAIGAKTRALGKDNELLFRISDDLRRFKELTKGHPVIMGRKTFESIGKPLPGRTNIVISRNASFEIAGAEVRPNLEEAIALAKSSPGSDEIFVIGGGQVYEGALPLADRLYLTLIESDDPGDVFFPPYPEFTSIIDREKRTDETTGLSYEFLTLER